MKMIVFCDVVPCCLVVYQRFRGAYCLHHQDDESDYMMQYPRRQSSSYLPPWEPEISKYTNKSIYFTTAKYVGLFWVSLWVKLLRPYNLFYYLRQNPWILHEEWSEGNKTGRTSPVRPDTCHNRSEVRLALSMHLPVLSLYPQGS
jgi:hypothetical protein